MRKLYFFITCLMLYACFFISDKHELQTANFEKITGEIDSEDENEGYDEIRQRDSLEFEKLKDPALGYVPAERLFAAKLYTENLKRTNRLNRVHSLVWTERGPIYDSVGPSNGNPRGTNSYTSGFINAILVDTLNDPTGNKVICGGENGGVWKCSNFLSSTPNWQKVNDNNETMAISSICQDPTNPNTMYYSTGAGYTGGVYFIFGAGLWKSTDGGNSWNKLVNTSSLVRSFKLVCDAAGNIYDAVNTSTVPVAQTGGLFRSTDGGTSWSDITPSDLTTNPICTDIEISKLSGRLHASFGYNGTVINHRYTDNPSAVTPATWNSSTGIRSITTPPSAIRLELACQDDILYGITVTPNSNADSCYKSVDGGVTWTKQNTAAYPTGVLNFQGFYNITLAINPENSNEFIIGGLDAYKSSNSGLTATTRLTNWIRNAPYVHADHHFMQWKNYGSESRIVIGCDGGLFVSRDGGLTWSDRNKNLPIKEFYSVSIHPDAGSPYLLAGAQDNGTHQLSNSGLSYSFEIMGGDGCFTHINQLDPKIQFTSVPFNNCYRSLNGGQTWSNFKVSNEGLFNNPYDYDDGQNIMYSSNGSNAIRRLPNANIATASSTEALPVSLLNGNSTALKVSPYTMNRVYLGGSTGRLLRLDNANTVTSASIGGYITNLTGASFPAGFINCINIGSSDQFLVAVFSNFGINNLWYSNDGGTSWSGIDGNLPDMPVRWAVFDPSDNNKLFIATATGVFHTDLVNGSSTVWSPELGLPTVMASMLKIRPSDNTLVASTYGRGLFTTVIPSAPQVRFTAPFATFTEATDANSGCRYYKDYPINISMVAPPTGDAVVTYNIQPGNTAIRGIDFDFTTNGDFSTPSSQHTFSNGVAATKPITLRIYDDGEVESTKNFTLGFTISGVTNGVAGALNTFNVTIISNDKTPVPLNNTSYTIGTTVNIFGNSSAGQPFDAKLQHKKTVLMYKANELISAGMSAGYINSIAFNLIKNSIRPYQNLTIEIDVADWAYAYNQGNWLIPTGHIYKTYPSYTTTNGWNTFNLDSTFYWDGIQNILIELCYENGTSDNSDFSDVAYGNVDPAALQTQGNLFYSNNITCDQDINSPFSFFTFGAKPQIQFGLSSGVTVTNTLSSSRSEFLGPNADVYFYSSSGVLMARVKNLSNFDYGCTQVVIDRAGTGSSQFWNNTPANYLMKKTFRVIPTNNNPSGQYELTLYFTQDEVNSWQTATSQSWNNIQLVKVDGQINQVTPSTPNAAGNVLVLTPTRTSFGADYSMTYTFSNGFSGFGAGVPNIATPLPVTLLEFKGKLQGENVLLNWSTTSEFNSKHFEIEKSYDGLYFKSIGMVQAAGTSSGLRQYSYPDPEKAVERNYYRLKMVDIDGHLKMSNVILIRNANVVQNMYVNNPFHDDIDIRFAKIPDGKVKLTLTDLSGKYLVLAEYNRMSQVGLRVNTNGKYLTNGVYILKVETDKEKFIRKLIKQ